MNELFGSRETWDRIPMAEDATFVDTPVGEVCLFCKEPIADGDFGMIMPYMHADGAKLVPVHHECEVLHIVGHQVGVCSCTNYADQPTERLAALECWRRLGDVGWLLPSS